MEHSLGLGEWGKNRLDVDGSVPYFETEDRDMGFWVNVGNNLASCTTLGLGILFLGGSIYAFFFMHNNILAIILFAIAIIIFAMSAAFSKKARR